MRLLHTAVCIAALGLIGIPASGSSHSVSEHVYADNAVRAAGQWAQRHDDGIAIAVRLGADTPVSPTMIEQTLRSDFKRHGITKLAFYFERGGFVGSSAVFQSKNHVWGPFGLAASRAEVAKAAAQLRFEIDRDLN